METIELNVLAGNIVDLFDTLLVVKGISIPCADPDEEKVRQGDSPNPLYGSECWSLLDNISMMISQIHDD